MNDFYKKSFGFWFILLIIALVNATIRELTYEPLLSPHIGNWAHQISTITGIAFFFIAIYFYLKRTKHIYTQKDLINVALIWILMTLVFETFMNMFIRKLSFDQTLQTYYFWNGETWIFVLISLIISPLIIFRIQKK